MEWFSARKKKVILTFLICTTINRFFTVGLFNGVKKQIIRGDVYRFEAMEKDKAEVFEAEVQTKPLQAVVFVWDL